MFATILSVWCPTNCPFQYVLKSAHSPASHLFTFPLTSTSILFISHSPYSILNFHFSIFTSHPLTFSFPTSLLPYSLTPSLPSSLTPFLPSSLPYFPHFPFPPCISHFSIPTPPSLFPTPTSPVPLTSPHLPNFPLHILIRTPHSSSETPCSSSQPAKSATQKNVPRTYIRKNA